jgi:hypothetical protein
MSEFSPQLENRITQYFQKQGIELTPGQAQSYLASLVDLYLAVVSCGRA